MTSDQISCLLAKLTNIRDAISALPSYGSSPPAHPWETSTLNEGSREYDDAKDLMWTLVKNPVPADSSWFWEMDLATNGLDANEDGIASEVIDCYNTIGTIVFQIAAGENIAQELMTGLGLNNGVQTLCHRNNGMYYIWQFDDGGQGSPIIQSSTFMHRLEGHVSGNVAFPGGHNAVQSIWINQPTGDA